MSKAGLSTGEMALAALHRRWWAAAIGAALALVMGYVWLRAVLGAGQTARWALLTAAVLAFVLAVLWRNLPRNRLPGGALLPGLGPANWVTIGRAILLALLTGFIALPRPAADLAWAPAILYTIAIAADLLDGTLARLTHRVTELGATLDMEFDGLGMLAAVTLAVRYGQLPWPYLLVGLARYLFVAGIWWLERRGRPVCALPASTFRRIAAGLQMAFISVVLWPLFGPPATFVAGACFGVPLVAGFVRDWLVVSDAVVPTSAGYRRVGRWYACVKRWLPPILRLVGAGVVITLAGASLGKASGVPFLGELRQPAAYLAWGPGGQALLVLVAALATTSAGLLVLGVTSRLTAIGLLAAVCADLAVVGYQPYHAWLLVVTIGLLYLGGGAYALWRADDALFERRTAGQGVK